MTESVASIPVEKPADHPTVQGRKVGVLLLNLGTPDGTDYFSMRRYLKEFLSDRRVIETNPIFWQILLNTVILTTRPSKSGRAYASIWNKEKDESPLRTITRAQAEGVEQLLRGRFRNVEVDWGMRYGNPTTASRIQALKDKGCDRILLFALYPQYAAATTATAYDQAFRHLMKMRWQPAVRTVPPYHDEPAYIDALARSIENHLATLDWEPEVVLASFHGLPKEYLLKGDPYHCQCQKTGRLLRERLGWGPEKLRVTFQSRFGPAEWLQPYTDETVETLAEEGYKRIAVVTPGFAADCVETLEEIAQEAAEEFMEAGGEKFAMIPCLNDSADSLHLIADLAARELQGWAEPADAAEMQHAAE